MLINAELASLFHDANDYRSVADADAPRPVLASATLRSGLPDALPKGNEPRPDQLAQPHQQAADYLDERADRRMNQRRSDAERDELADRRKKAQAVLIDTRIRRSRRSSDLKALIDFEI